MAGPLRSPDEEQPDKAGRVRPVSAEGGVPALKQRVSIFSALLLLTFALLAGCGKGNAPQNGPAPESVSAAGSSSVSESASGPENASSPESSPASEAGEPESVPESESSAPEESVPEENNPEESSLAKALPDLILSEEEAEMISEIIRLTNEQREQNGLHPLEEVETVDILAAIRAEEASESWSHTRPDGQNFHTIFAEYGISFRGYGENLLTADYPLTAEEAVQAWMDSPSHRENLLREEFDGIGAGLCTNGGNWYFCQLFITR